MYDEVEGAILVTTTPSDVLIPNTVSYILAASQANVRRKSLRRGDQTMTLTSAARPAANIYVSETLA